MPVYAYTQEEASQLVTQAYCTILKREADEGGFNNSVNLLTNANWTAKQLVLALATSEEYKRRFFDNRTTTEYVTQIYHTLLQREPDPEGLTNWINHVEQHGWQIIIEGALNSDEYMQRFGNNTIPGAEKCSAIQLVTQAYRLILKREADEGGFNNYVNLLTNEGWTAKQLVFALATSEEYKQKFFDNQTTTKYVTQTYQILLQREPDPEGLKNWINMVEQHGWRILIEGILNSEEYMQRFGNNAIPGAKNYHAIQLVTQAYRIILKREPDEGGSNDYVNLLTNQGWTAKQLVLDLATSEEYQRRFFDNRTTTEYVTQIYHTLLQREPNPEELTNGINMVEQHGWRIIIERILNSEEYMQRFGNNAVPGTEKYLTTQPYAILIHPNGQGTGYKQEEAVNFMIRHIYQTLLERGYTNKSIYLLSYQNDFKLNSNTDYHIVDQSASVLTDEHIRAAFDWAKSKGQHNYPLLVTFVGHGIDRELLLDPDRQQTLTAEELKILLDDYQSHTNNSVVVILEACHTGTFINTLAAPNRLIISSTDDNKAYYYDVGNISFTKLYFEELLLKTFQKALESVQIKLAKYFLPFNLQKPQFNGPNEILEQCLGSCITSLEGKPSITIQLQKDIKRVFTNEIFELIAEVTETASEVYAKAIPSSDITNPWGYFESEIEANSEVEANSIGKIGGNQWKFTFKFNEKHENTSYTVFVRAKNNENEMIGKSAPILVVSNPLPPLQKSKDSNGNLIDITTETTSFYGGIAVDGQHYQTPLQVSLSQPVVIAGKMIIGDRHITQTADIVAFATYLPDPNNPNNKLFYMLDSNGVPVSWDGDMAHLMTFKQVNLPKYQKVAIYSGHLVPGNLKIYFGYRLSDGTVITNDIPIEVDVL
jgi:hypothetical protein